MKKRNLIFKLFISLAIFVGLVSGVFISASEIFSSVKLDSTFNGTYEALVSVNNINAKKNDSENIPNGDAKEAANILYKRLSPLGTNDVTVEREGQNYLRVKTRADNYNNETLFKNDIQKSGNVYILSKKASQDQKTLSYNDVLFTTKRSSDKASFLKEDSKGDAAKDALSDKITSATSSPIKSGTQKIPAITYNLKSDASFIFPASKDDNNKTLKDSPNSGGNEPTSANISILSDADSLFNDIRNYYLLIRSNNINKTQAEHEYWNEVLSKIINIYKTAKDDKTSVVKSNVLRSLFHGTYVDDTPGKNNIRQSISLVDLNDESINSGDKGEAAFKKIADTWEFDIDANDYVYGTNSKSDDFNKQDGKYNEKVNGYSSNGSKVKIGYVEEVFDTLINTLLGDWFLTSKASLEDSFVKRINNYFIFDGTIQKTGKATTAVKKGTGYVNGNTLVTGVGSYSTAKIGETIFNASGKGYVFNVDSIRKNDPLISNLKFDILMGIIIVVFGIIALYLLFAYRMLGLFVIVVALAITFLTLLICSSWLSLIFGVETILGTIILFALNTELSMLIINSMKKNIYVDKRGNKTSLNIALKENAGLIMDVLACILLPSSILFWLSSSSLKTFSMIIIVGVVLSVAGQLLFMLLCKLIVSTDIFKKIPALFIKNIIGNNQFEMLVSLRKENLNQKKEKALQKKYLEKVKKIDEKIKKLNDKSEKILQAKKTKSLEKQIKFNDKLQDQLQVLFSKLSKESKPKKILKLNEKIEVIQFAINPIKSSADSYNKDVNEVNIYELNNFKSKSSLISKLLVISITVLGILAGIITPLTGINFDSSMSSGVSYIIFGNTKINESLDSSFRNLEEKSDNNDFKNKLKKVKSNYDEEKQKAKDEEAKIKLERDTLKRVLELSYLTKSYLESVINDKVSYSSSGVDVKAGDNFNYNGTASNDEKKQSWIEIYIPNISPSDSHKIKRFFTYLDIQYDDEGSNNSTNGGFISKKHIASSSIDIIVKSLIAIAISVLVLGVYIVVRFKWTYFIALALSAILFILITAALIFGLHLPVGVFTIIAAWFLYLFFIAGSIIAFAKFQSQILAKDESSLINHFKDEINEIVKLKSIKYGHKKNIRNQKNKFNIEVFELKLERNNKILNDKENKKAIKKEYKEIIKAKKNALKKELKEYKIVSKSEFKSEKFQIQENIRRSEKSNNYLLLIALDIFKQNISRFLFVISAYLLLFILFTILLTPIWGFSLILVLGTMLSWIIISFIAIPLLLRIEQSRIRRRLAFKRFINGIKVRNEEQIIEGIND